MDFERSFSRNELVIAPEGTLLLVLTFDVHPKDCAQLDRRRLVVKDKEGKTYDYGGWRLQSAEYVYCGPDESMLVMGPWGNAFWDPIGVKPDWGSILLVYVVPAEARGLKFTDGLVTIDLEPYLKRERERERSERP